MSTPRDDSASTELAVVGGNRDSAIVQTPSPFTTTHGHGHDDDALPPMPAPFAVPTTASSSSTSTTLKQETSEISVASGSATITAHAAAVVEGEDLHDGEQGMPASQAAQIAFALVSQDSDVFDPSTSREHAALAHMIATSPDRQTPPASPKQHTALPLLPSSPTAPATDAMPTTPSLAVTAAQLSAHVSLLHHLHAAFSALPPTTQLAPPLVAALEERYFAWLAMLTTHAATTGGAADPLPVPPADVLAVWYAHMVADVTRFADDLGALFGQDARDAVLAMPGLFPACAVPLAQDQAAWHAFSGLPWELQPKHTLSVACCTCATVSLVDVQAYANPTGVPCSGCAACVSAAGLAGKVAEGRMPRAQAPLCRFAIDLAHVVPMVGAQVAEVIGQLDAAAPATAYSTQTAAEVSLVLRRLLQAAATARGDAAPLAVDADVLVAYWTSVVADPQGYLDYSLDQFGKIVVLNQAAVTLSAVAQAADEQRRTSMEVVVVGEEKPRQDEEDEAERTIESVAADLDKLEQQVAALSMPTTPRKAKSAASAAAAPTSGSKGPSVASLRAMFESTKRAQRTVTVNVPGALDDAALPDPLDLLSGEALDGHLDLLESFAQHLSLARHQDKHAEGKVDTLYLVKAERRYYAWLVMLAAHPEAADVMPPVDVLLLWYNHMIHTPTYVADLQAIFGADTVPALLTTPFPLRKFLVQALTKQFDSASQMAWEKFTGVPYVLLHNADVVEHAWLLQCPTCCSYAPIEARDFVALRMGQRAIECSVCWRTVTKTQLLLMRDPQVYTAFAMFSVDLVRTVQEWRAHVLRVVAAVEFKHDEDKETAVRKYVDLAWRRSVVVTDAQGNDQVYHLEARDWSAADVLLAYLTHTLWPNAYVRASREFYGTVADHHTIALVMQNDNVNFHHWDTVRGRPLRLRKSAPVAEAALVSESNIEDVVVEDGKNLMEEARIESNPLLAAVSAAKLANMRGVTGIVNSVTLTPTSVRKYARYLVSVAQGHVDRASVPPLDVAVVMAAHASQPAQFVADVTQIADNRREGVMAVLEAADQAVLRAATNVAAGEATWALVEQTVPEPQVLAFPLDMAETARKYRQQLAVLETVPTKDAQDAYARFMDMSVVIADDAGRKHMYSIATRDEAVEAGHLVHTASPAAYAEWFQNKYGEEVAGLAHQAAVVMLPADSVEEPEIQVDQVQERDIADQVQERELVVDAQEQPESSSEASVTIKAEVPSAYGMDLAEMSILHSLRDSLVQRAVLFADPAYVAAAVRRYSKYMHAVATGGDATVTPPLDVAMVALAHMSANPAAFQRDAETLGLTPAHLEALARPVTRATSGKVNKAAWGALAGVGFELAPPALLSPPMPTCNKCGLSQSVDSAQFALGTAKCLACKARLAEHWPEFSVDLLRATMALAAFLSNVPVSWTAEQVTAEYARYVAMSSLIVSSSSSLDKAIPEVYSIATLTDAAKLGHIVHASMPAKYQAFFIEQFGVQVRDTFQPEPVLEYVDCLTIDVTLAEEQEQQAAPEPVVATQYLAHVREMVHFADLVENNSAHLLCQYAEFVRVAAKGPMQHMTASVALAAFAHHMLVDSYADDIVALMGGDADHQDLSAPLFVTQALNHSLNNGFAAGTSPMPTTVLPGAMYRLRMALPELLTTIRAAVANHMPFPEASYADVKEKMVAIAAMDGSKRMYSAQFSPAHALAHLQHIATGHWYTSYCQTSLGHVSTLFNLPDFAIEEPESPTVVVAVNDGYVEATTPRAAAASFSTRSLSPVLSSAQLEPLVSEAQVRAWIAHAHELEVDSGVQFTSTEVAQYVSELRSSPMSVKYARIALVHKSLPAKYAADHAALETGANVSAAQLAVSLNTQLAVVRQVLVRATNADQQDLANGVLEYARAMDDAVMVTKDDGSIEFFALAKLSPAAQVAHLAHMHNVEAYATFSKSRFGTLVSMLPAKADATASQDDAPVGRLVVTVEQQQDDESTQHDATASMRGFQAAKNSPVTFEAVSQFAQELSPIVSLTWSMHWVALYVRYLTDAEDATYEQAPVAPAMVKLVALLHMSLGADFRSDVEAIVGKERFAHATTALSAGLCESNWDWHDVDMPIDEHEAHAVALNARLAARFAQLQHAIAQGSSKLTTDSNVAYQRILDDTVVVESQHGAKYLYSLAPIAADVELMHWFHVSQFAEYEAYMLAHFGLVLPLIAVPRTTVAAATPADAAQEDGAEEQVQAVSREIEFDTVVTEPVKDDAADSAAMALAGVAAVGAIAAASALELNNDADVTIKQRDIEFNNVSAEHVPETVKSAQSIKSLVISLHDIKDETAAASVVSSSTLTVTEAKLSLPSTVREGMITEAEVDDFKAYWLANENEYRFSNLIFALNAIQRYQAWITLAPTVLPPPDVAVVHQIHKTVRTFEGDLPESLMGASFLNVHATEQVISSWEHETGMPWLLEVSNTYYCTKCHGTITIRSTTEKCLVCREPLLATEYAVQIFRQTSQFVETIRKLRQVSSATVVKSYALWLDQATIMTHEDGSQYLISAQSNSDEALVGHLIHTQAALRWRVAVWALFARAITFFSPILTKQAQSNSRPVSIAAADLPTPVVSPMPVSRPVTPRISLSISRPGTPISSRPTTPTSSKAGGAEQSRDLSLDPVALAYGRILVDQPAESGVDAYSKADKFFVPEDVMAAEVSAEMVDRHWRMLRMLLQIETSHYAALILRSESRYLKWLTMIAETQRTDLIAPVDVALIAHVHAQFPDVLYADLVALFGVESADLIMQHSILAEDVTRYQQEIDPLSESAWEQFTGEPYLYHHAKAGTTYLVSCPKCSTIQTIAHDALVSLKSEAEATLACSACTEANDLVSLAKVNRGLAPFGLNFIAQVTVWRSRMHKFLNESGKLEAQSTAYQYQQYARLTVEVDNGSGVPEMYSLTDLTPAVQFGHATHLVFAGAYRRTMLRRFGHATTILRVEEPLPAIPVAMSKRESLLGISPSSSPKHSATVATRAVPMPPVPAEEETVTNAAERQRSRTLSLGAASAMTVEPAPEFDMRPEVLVTFYHLCSALMSSPDFTFADDKMAQLYWTRAEDRYLKYLMLMQHTIVEGHALPLPPLDVLMMWLVHIMDSHRYVEDLVRVFGDVKMLNFAFPLDKVEVFLTAYHGQPLSAANWQEFVPASHAESWVRFAEQPFALESEVLDRTWMLACPFCSNNQELEADLYTEMRTGSRMLFCKDCEKWITLPIVSAWRMVADFRKAERGQGHIGGTLLNFNKGKIDYKLAHSVHKLLFFTHEKSLAEILEARLNERDVVNPWKELDLAAILHDYVQAAVEKEYTGKSKELKRKADIITGKILSYYQNVMTPLSLDLIMGRAAWSKLHADIAEHLGEGFAETEAQVVIDRYVKFLGLLEERRKATLKDEERYKNLVPAIDILLAHRCHLLDPLVYKKYCEFKFGKIMDFTRFTCKDELTAEYREMAALWSQKYSTPFDLTFKKKKKKGIKKVFGMLFGSRK